MKTCKDYPDVDCCTSCHDELDLGYDYFIELYDVNGEITHWVCCTVANWIKDNENCIFSQRT